MAVEFESRLDRRQAAAFLTARGYRTAPATLAKLACIGGGPTFESLAVSPISRGRLARVGEGKNDGAAAVNKRSGRRAVQRRTAQPVARVQLCSHQACSSWRWRSGGLPCGRQISGE